jgi:hypothetical protein
VSGTVAHDQSAVPWEEVPAQAFRLRMKYLCNNTTPPDNNHHTNHTRIIVGCCSLAYVHKGIYNV